MSLRELFYGREPTQESNPFNRKYIGNKLEINRKRME